MATLSDFTPEGFLRALPGLLRPTIQQLLDDHRIVLGHRFDESEACSESGSRFKGTFVILGLHQSLQAMVACWQWVGGPIPEHIETIHWQIVPMTGPADGIMSALVSEFRCELERK